MGNEHLESPRLPLGPARRWEPGHLRPQRPPAVGNEHVAARSPCALGDRTGCTLLAAVGDPAVYVMIGGKRHHVPDPQTFEAEGYDWSNIHWISLEELNNVPLGDPVPHVTRFIIDTGDQHLGRNHYMHTKCGIDLTTGEVAGTTRVWTLHGSAASTAWFRSSLWTAPACRLPRTSPSGMA